MVREATKAMGRGNELANGEVSYRASKHGLRLRRQRHMDSKESEPSQEGTSKRYSMSNANKVGLVLAILLGGWHLVWSILVATGVGQVLYDFILWAHMIHLAVKIGPFDLTASITLIVVTAIFGYVIGYIASLVWNRMHR
jgi:hypothetical protein